MSPSLPMNNGYNFSDKNAPKKTRSTLILLITLLFLLYIIDSNHRLPRFLYYAVAIPVFISIIRRFKELKSYKSSENGQGRSRRPPSADLKEATDNFPEPEKKEPVRRNWKDSDIV